MLIAKNMLQIPLKKGQPKGIFRKFIDAKCKQNKESDKKVNDKVLNFYEINQLRENLL